MEKRQIILGQKSPKDFTTEERKYIIEEYLRTCCKKRDIWEKYTGQSLEHGLLLTWMRKLGYIDIPESNKLPSKETLMKNSNELQDNIELKQRIEQLEKALLNSELRATALDTMIEVAEKELKISIRKKSNTKQSKK